MSDTDFKAVPMKLEEARYSYRNSQQISSQTGLIGYLRADMGTTGTEFWSTWNDFRKDLKTSEFKSEFDDVINSFRENGQFLSDRQTLSSFCDDTQSVLKFGERYGAGRDYGVRVNTQDYAYLMRLNPHKGEYNLYCYCYRKDWLDHHLERARRGIRFINPHYKELFRIPDGDSIDNGGQRQQSHSSAFLFARTMLYLCTDRKQDRHCQKRRKRLLQNRHSGVQRNQKP